MLSNITSYVNISATLLNSTFICSHNMNKLFCRRHGKWKKGLSGEEHGGNGRNVAEQKVILKVWTQQVLRFHFFVWLLLIAINFLRACDKNYSIAATRNAWVANLACLCVIENRSYVKRWMVEGATTLKKGLRN
jgi:hypothetical protein